MTNDFDKNIAGKFEAIRSEAFLAKKNFDTQKEHFEQLSPEQLEDESIPEISALRHEIKLLVALLEASKFDDIVHLISRPVRLIGINFLIGFIRGLAFSLALIIMILIVLMSLSDLLF
jgi:hypothetical protein